MEFENQKNVKITPQMAEELLGYTKSKVIFSPPERNDGMMLADLARTMRTNMHLVMLSVTPLTDKDFEEINVARAFMRRGPAFVFRAIMENWDRFRIVRELY